MSDSLKKKERQDCKDQDRGDLNYILITPAKNEEESLPELISTISNQTLLPVAWFIIDDGSDDRTFQIISNASKEHSWIHPLRLRSRGGYDMDEHYSRVCRTGFNYGQHFCKRQGVPYGFIALSDADTTYPEDYFNRVISFLKENGDFGIVSGRYLIKRDDSTYAESQSFVGMSDPYGTGRIWRRQAFEETDGYTITKAPDTVSNIMAMLRGWKIARLNFIEFYQMRETSTGGRTDLWSGYWQRGRRYYFVGGNPLGSFNNSIYLLLFSGTKRPAVKSTAFFFGYLSSYLKGEDRTDNEEIRKYMGDYWTILSNYRLFISGLATGSLEK